MYVGITVPVLPLGEIVVGADGAPDAPPTVNVRGALHAPVPKLLVALTNQLYGTPLASAVAGVAEQVPVPAPQFAPAAV